jgi:peptidoglycan/xylan/chitin deacetylase (PgdA/CDA1 family)
VIHEHLPPSIYRAVRRAKQRIKPRGLILMYHRVAEEEVDPWRLCVTPTNFEKHLEVLRSTRARVMHLRDLARGLRSGRVPVHSVVITFDDGYVDNLMHARPLLEKYEAPATVFVASGYLGSDEEFWWDSLERVFLAANELPSSLEMVIGGEQKRWTLGEDAVWTFEERRRHGDWRPYNAPMNQRQRLYQDIRRLMMSLTSSDRARVTHELLAWAGVSKSARPARRPMDEQQLRSLASGDLVSIGAHSISHPELARLSGEEQEHELRASKQRLEEVLEGGIDALAYPHGSCTAETKKIARNLGYDFACGTQRRVVDRGADLYQLPRIGVHDVPTAEFRSLLGEFLAL